MVSFSSMLKTTNKRAWREKLQESRKLKVGKLESKVKKVNIVKIQKVQKSFEEANSFEIRSLVSGKIREQFMDRVPIIVETSPDLHIIKKKFLAPREMSLKRFFIEARKCVNISRTAPLYVHLTHRKTILSLDELVGSADATCKSPDGFLYFTFTKGE